MKFHTKYDPFKDKGFATEGESLTRQSEADACDINLIMERFDRTGQLPLTMKQAPHYGDARAVDFQTAKQIVIEAESQFKQLSGEARAYFNHNPENLLKAVADGSEDNIKKLKELGIVIEPASDPVELLKQVVKNTEGEKQAPVK
nr:MAG: internal scaffolding protein [Microvirus sp.]